MAWRNRGGSFPLVNHIGDGNPKEKMKKKKNERKRRK